MPYPEKARWPIRTTLKESKGNGSRNIRTELGCLLERRRFRAVMELTSRHGGVEVWRVCEGYPKYEVSNLGNIRLKNGPSIFVHVNKSGYRMVKLSRWGEKRNITLHTLIAWTFSPLIPNGSVVSFKDGDRSNCAVDNLFFTTRGDIIRMQWQRGDFKNRDTSTYRRGPAHNFYKHGRYSVTQNGA